MGASRTLQALEHTMMTIVARSLAIALLLCSASFASHEVDAIVPEDAEVFSDVYEKAATKVPSTDVVQLQDGSGSTHNHEDHDSGSAHVNEGHPEASSAASQQECSPGCRVGWEKDNWCDHKCNNAACNWDNGRCGGHASSNAASQESSAAAPAAHSSAATTQSASQQECSPGCRVGWEKDSVCDHARNNAACNWDNGRCGGHASSSAASHQHHQEASSATVQRVACYGGAMDPTGHTVAYQGMFVSKPGFLSGNWFAWGTCASLGRNCGNCP